MFSDAMILVVGADPQDREIILQALGETCHVVAAQNTEDALAHISDRVQLVICESNGASFRGEDLLRRWKSTRSGTPFLMLIGEHDVNGAINAMKTGADDCIVKPIAVGALRDAAKALLANAVDRPVNGSNDPSSGRRRSNIDIPPDTSLEDLERAAVEQALVQHHGNRTHAARTLGISVRTLQRKLKAWGMPIVSFPSSPSAANFLRSTPSFRAHVH
ncbi:MAG: helix-turn-helix domain-containing protein [Pirellulales bacterium]